MWYEVEEIKLKNDQKLKFKTNEKPFCPSEKINFCKSGNLQSLEFFMSKGQVQFQI